MPSAERKQYFDQLRVYCSGLNNKHDYKITATQKIMAGINRKTRPFDLEIKGVDNVPKGNCLFVGNHSNTHDAFITAEVLCAVGKPACFLAAIEGLSFIELQLFKSARATMIDRTNKESSNEGLLVFCGKIINGDCGFIFGEGTWNLHPVKPMQDIKIGAAKVGAITGVPIIPIIYEYIEVPYICRKEKDLYSKCIAQIGKPIIIDSSVSLIEQTMKIQTVMEKMRRKLWAEFDVKRDNLNDINPSVYVNHTWLKKYGTPLFEFNSAEENKILRNADGRIPENEYFIDDGGVFKPGIIKKELT